MLFEWDEIKYRENLERRKVDFEVAIGIFDGPVISAEDTRVDYGERRFRAIGEFEGQSYVVVYTDREQVRHIVTAWKVGAAGAKRYRALFARGATTET
jgi:uncharacterized DUF497 family protein